VRTVLVVGVALLLLSGSAAASGTTSLRIRYWPDGKAGSSTVWTLRCAPPRGTHPRPAAACDVLARLQDPFAPTPKDVGCIQLYGGPQVVRVAGTLRGERVWATFRRRDGCEIARWARAGALLPTPPRGPT
jgi:Subtilisin inhibitor-like